MHDIIGDIIDWDQANKAYMAGEGQTGERYVQRLEAAEQMAEIEARWQHLPGGFHGERKRIKIHIQAVADTALVTSREELCWLAIAAASAWLPSPANPAPATGRPVQAGSGGGPAEGREAAVHVVGGRGPVADGDAQHLPAAPAGARHPGGAVCQ
jgi:hypothetical protein